MRKILASLFVAAVLAGCGGEDSTGKKSEPSASKTQPKDLSEVIWHDYTKKGFPKLYETVGEGSFAGINEKVVEAAKQVDAKGVCDEVVDAAPSQSRSTKDNVVFFVDCADKSRFYVSELDIKNNASSGIKLPGDGKGNASQAQVDDCRQQIKTQFSKSGEVNIKTVLGFASDVQDYGVVVINQDFTVKDGSGKEEEISATCRYQGQKTDGNIDFH